jgi:TolA-binding protein
MKKLILLSLVLLGCAGQADVYPKEVFRNDQPEIQLDLFMRVQTLENRVNALQDELAVMQLRYMQVLELLEKQNQDDNKGKKDK